MVWEIKSSYIDYSCAWPSHFKIPGGPKMARAALSIQAIDGPCNNNNNNNLRVSNIRVSNRTLIYNVCPKSALT